MSTILELSDQRSLVRLEGEIDIGSSQELKALLLEGLSKQRPLHVDMTQASALDITAIQLLWAAAREAGKRGIQITVSGGVPERIQQITTDAGLAGLWESLAKKAE